MNFSLTTDRLKVWIAIALMALLAFGSFWVLESLRKSGDDNNASAGSETTPDYYVEQFNIVKRANENEVSYHITGQHLSHFPKNDQTDIQKPHVQRFQSGEIAMDLQSDRAVLLPQSEQVTPKRAEDVVHLYGNVDVVRPDNTVASYMRLQTDYLMLLPDADTIQTDKAVMLRTHTSEAHAIGMVADNATQHLDLLQKTRIKFQKSSAFAALPH